MRKNKRAQFQPHPDQLDLEDYIKAMADKAAPSPPNPTINWAVWEETRETDTPTSQRWCMVRLTVGQYSFPAGMQISGLGASGNPLTPIPFEDAMQRLIGAISVHAVSKGWFPK
jgi:hypothetical protein